MPAILVLVQNISHQGSGLQFGEVGLATNLEHLPQFFVADGLLLTSAENLQDAEGRGLGEKVTDFGLVDFERALQ